jgi:hypothetical protein
MTSPSLLRQFTVTASTKRAPAFAAGKRGPAVTFLASVLISPLTPASKALMVRQDLRTPYTMLECFCPDEHDIQNGDFLVIDGREYPVRFVETWTGFLLVMVEDLQNTRPQ